MAITENLQRQDISPLEEANAFQTLIERKRHDVASLMLKFGKSESYIRSRLKLNDLISDFKNLFSSGEINLSIALEIVKYNADIQQEIHNKQFTKDGYDNWRGITATKLAQNIERTYTMNLKHYYFDKTDCLSCPLNSSNFSLFGAENRHGYCSKNECLSNKNVEYLVNEAIRLSKSNPALSFCTDPHFIHNGNVEKAVKTLTENGYQFTEIDIKYSFSKEPVQPQQTDYSDTEAYKEAVSIYNDDLLEYEMQMHEIEDRKQADEISVFACICPQNIEFYYVKNNPSEVIPVAPAEKLKKQDKRNKEIAGEKIVEDIRKYIRDTDIPCTDFTDFENKMLYFFMLSDLQRSHFTLFLENTQSKWFLSDEEKIQVINNMTEEQKTIIRRDFIIKYLSGTFGTSPKSLLMLEFARLHFPDALAEIEKQHNDVYRKRHERIMEKLNAFNENNN